MITIAALYYYCQGGGPGSDENDTTDPFNRSYTVCTVLPMEVITITERADTVNVSTLTEIPSQSQVRGAISKLHKKQEEFPDKYTYIKFPFGIMEYDGLKILQMYHEHIQRKENVSEERAWLEQLEHTCEGLGVNMEKIY